MTPAEGSSWSLGYAELVLPEVPAPGADWSTPAICGCEQARLHILREEAEEKERQTHSRHQGENPHGCGVHITLQSRKSQQHFNVKGTSAIASAKQTSLYLKQGQVL